MQYNKSHLVLFVYLKWLHLIFFISNMYIYTYIYMYKYHTVYDSVVRLFFHNIVYKDVFERC